MKNLPVLLLMLIAPAYTLTAQVSAGNSAGLITNLSTSSEIVNAFSFPPVFGQFDSEGIDSLDLNRDSVYDAFFICNTCNTYDCGGGFTSIHAAYGTVECIVDNDHYPIPLELGAAIDSAQHWEVANQMVILAKVNGLFGYMQTGVWLPNPEGYLGIRLLTGTDTLYGWLKLRASVSTSNGSASIRVQEWAIEHDPSQSPNIQVSFTPEKPVYCTGDSVTLSAEAIGAEHFEWQLWDGTKVFSNSIQRALPDSTVQVIFQAQNASGISSRTLTFELSPLELTVPDINLTCAAPSATLQATTNIPAQIGWLIGLDTFYAPNLPVIDAPVGIAVIAEDANGCYDAAQLNITADMDVPEVSIQQVPGIDSVLVFPILQVVVYAWTVPGVFEPVLGTSVPVDQAGLYTVVATNIMNGCTSSASTNVVITSNNLELSVGSIQVFPNPTNDQVTIKNETLETLNFQLYDGYGRRILVFGRVSSQAQATFGMLSIPPGMYWLFATTPDGGRRMVSKIEKR